MSEALDEQQRDPSTQSSPLGRALRFGRHAGALAELCRLGRLDEAEAATRFAALDRSDATAAIWQRLRPAPAS